MNESDKPIHNAAIASLALAIAGLFIFGVLAGLGAIGAGFYAKNQIEKGNGRGLKMALTGIWGGAAVAALALLFALAVEPEGVVTPTPVDSWPGLAQHIFDTFVGD